MDTGIKVGDIMTRNFVSTSPETDLRNCAKLMVKKRVGSLIIQEGEKLSENNLSIKRPEGGIEPKFWDSVINKQTNKLIKKDTSIYWNDVLQ